MTDATGAGEVYGLAQSIAYAQQLAAEAGQHGPDGNETYLQHLATARVTGDGLTSARDMQDAFAAAAAAAEAHAAQLAKQTAVQEVYDQVPDAGDKAYLLGADDSSASSDLTAAAGSLQEAVTVTPTSPPADAGPPHNHARLIHDDPDWWYLGHGITSATRRIRTYEQPDGRLIAVVTESGDGTSITNAAETVIAQIRAEHPGRQVEVIEHNPASSITGETFDRIDLTPAGNATWTRLPAEHIGGMLGPGVFTNGTGPSPRARDEYEDDGWYLEAQGGALDGRRVHLNDPDGPATN